MKFYAAVWSGDEPTAGNLEWFTNKRDAEREANANGGRLFSIDVPTDKKGLLAFLQDNLWRAEHGKLRIEP